MKLYLIDEDQLAALRRVQRRLHTEDRLNGDEMRDLGHAVQGVADVCEQIPVPDGHTVNAGYVAIEVHFPEVVLARLRQAMTVRSLATEGPGVIEAFLGRVLEDIADGGGTHEYKSGTITTKVLPARPVQKG